MAVANTAKAECRVRGPRQGPAALNNLCDTLLAHELASGVCVIIVCLPLWDVLVCQQCSLAYSGAEPAC